MPQRRRSTRRLVVIAILLAFVVILGLETLFAVSAATESGCGLCHIPQRAADDLSSTAHADVECSRCHRLPGVSGALRYNLQAVDHLVTWLTPSTAPPGDRAADVVSACPACHTGLTESIVTVDGVAMSHKEVVSATGGATNSSMSCVACHDGVAHAPPRGGPAALDPHSLCVRCHDGVTTSDDCAVCHVGADLAGLTDAASGTVAHPSEWDALHGMGDQATCPLCHPRAYCGGCHDGVGLPHDTETYIYTHGDEGVSIGEACLGCHARSTCDGCHQLPMPHAADYLPEHDRDAAARGTEVCAGCHAPQGCADCHARHIHPGVPDSVREKVTARAGIESSPSVTPGTSTTEAGP